MRKILFFFFLFVFTTIALADSGQKITIGISTSLTGPGASWGTDIKNAALFANNYFGHGRYQLIFEDDHCTGKDAVTIAHKLANDKSLRAVFGNCSATVISAAPIYRQAKIMMMVPLASSPKISTLPGVIIRTIPSDARAAEMLHERISAEHKIVGVLTEQADYSVDFFDSFKKNKGNFQIINEFFLAGDTDFSSVLTHMKAKKIDALFINSNTEQSFVQILREAHELKLDRQVKIYGAIIPGSTTFLELAGNLADGITYVDFPENESSLTPEGKKIYDQFVQEYGPLKAWNITFATTFEAFRVLDMILQSGKEPGEFIHGKTFSGVIGDYSFNDHGDIIGLNPVMKKIENGIVSRLSK